MGVKLYKCDVPWQGADEIGTAPIIWPPNNWARTKDADLHQGFRDINEGMDLDRFFITSSRRVVTVDSSWVQGITPKVPNPLVNLQKAIANGHRNSGFTH
jgi:hypothetical protein